ncbi:MAG: ribose-phosphate pyrophosphokinase [Bacteroidia bacterium]|nr:ribose-phosphate pyrophosphokinase [Bacteroidia bacterium]
MPLSKNPIKFFAGSASKYLAEKIVEHFNTKLGNSTLVKFNDGEFQPSYEETVRGTNVFIIQSTFPPVDNLFELLLMVDAAKRASACSVIAVIPYFGFARQDRKDKPRVSIGSKLIADLLATAGVSRIITMDLHADQIQGFFNVPVDHLYASAAFIPYIQSLNLPNLVLTAPDMGGARRANAYAKFLNCEIAMCYKLRERPGEIYQISILGDVAGKNVIILDDMIDSAGTLIKATEAIMNNGAISTRACASHAVLSGTAYEKISNSPLTEVIVTDSIPLKRDCSKIKVLSIAPLFANVIKKIYNYESISSTFVF